MVGEFRKTLLRSPEPERMPLLLEYLRDLVGRVIGISGRKLSENQPLSELGLDSLMALELRTPIESDLAITLPLAKLMQGPVTFAILRTGGDGTPPFGRRHHSSPFK